MRSPTTGDSGLDEAIEAVLDDIEPIKNRNRHRSIIYAAVRLAQSDAERVNVKIASAALDEMVRAFAVFRPYLGIPKVTIFGSARTQPNDGEYLLAKDLAANMAAEGWMVVTGAGPGIMQAASEGAGRDMSLGVSIRLPFESEANEVIAGGDKLIAMRYFFTRKLMLVKESKAYVSLPGGFGTLDETFELLTLQQTGKADPEPIVLLDIPGGRYWHHFDTFVELALEERGLISDTDRQKYLITDSLSATTDEIRRFY
ncbi:MAG: TIGR00730 family Rossman fold protein, partial [Acidimicrobiales bacterium]